MFSGIKDKILHVKNNVSLFASDDSTSKSDLSPRQPPTFNAQAGAFVLQHFQNHWQDLHNLNEHNAEAAQNAATQIEVISCSVTRSKTNIELMSHMMISSNLSSNIDLCLKKVQQLYETCQEVERKLEQLEDCLDEGEFDQMVHKHWDHLEGYRERKQDTLEKLQESLEEQYQKKLLDAESSKRGLLEERQKVFQEAFKSDLEVYKSLGTIPKVHLSKSQNGALLEEIQLDFDQNELEQFFNDEPSDSAKT